MMDYSDPRILDSDRTGKDLIARCRESHCNLQGSGWRPLLFACERELTELLRKVESAKERAYAAEQRADRMIDHHVLECRKLEIENEELRRKVEAVEKHWLYPALSMATEPPPWCNGANGTWHITRELARVDMWASFGVKPEPTEGQDDESLSGVYAPPRPKRVLHSDVVEFSVTPEPCEQEKPE
jgi:hypothetical protein